MAKTHQQKLVAALIKANEAEIGYARKKAGSLEKLNTLLVSLLETSTGGDSAGTEASPKRGRSTKAVPFATEAPKKRGRRTKAEIEAAKAAEAAAAATAPVKRRGRRTKAEIEAAKAAEAAAATAAPKKRGRRTKAEIEAAKAAEAATAGATPVKRRGRRTKAEIEAAKAAEAAAAAASGEAPRKKRGRRTKAEMEAARAAGEEMPKRGSGRPRKAAAKSEPDLFDPKPAAAPVSGNKVDQVLAVLPTDPESTFTTNDVVRSLPGFSPSLVAIIMSRLEETGEVELVGYEGEDPVTSARIFRRVAA